MDGNQIMQLYIDRIKRYHQLSQEALERRDYEKADYYCDKVDQMLAAFSWEDD